MPENGHREVHFEPEAGRKTAHGVPRLDLASLFKELACQGQGSRETTAPPSGALCIRFGSEEAQGSRLSACRPQRDLFRMDDVHLKACLLEPGAQGLSVFRCALRIVGLLRDSPRFEVRRVVF